MRGRMRADLDRVCHRRLGDGPADYPDEANELIEALPDILASDDALVPQHWRLEVANLARMAIRKRRLTEALLADAFQALAVFDMIIDTQTDSRAWTLTLDLAARHNLTAYDAAYLELAMRSGRAIVTNDTALKRASASEMVEILSK